MCGIAGSLGFDGRPVDFRDVRRMVALLAHRGHDGVGYAIGGAPAGEDAIHCSVYPGIGLGHRRLSVIDLNAHSDQPMSYAHGQLWITYNGELYNYLDLRAQLSATGYTFDTQSDTEVLLAAYHCWGEDCLERFNGMFAFAIWDERARSLFCARDPVGIKPFYYLAESGAFTFASESRALAGMAGGRIDTDALGAYMMSMYVPGTWSIFEGVRKLPPGTALTVHTDGRRRERRYWSLPTEAPDRCVDEAELEALLQKAVTRQLCGDVPVGAFLSGGVDSSIVVAMAAPQSDNFRTYSLAYEGHGTDETPYARRVAEAYGTNHREILVRRTEVLGQIDVAMAQCTEPIADTSLVANHILAQAAAQDGVKVLLNGTGGDEVFAGYRRYLPGKLPRRLLNAMPAQFARGIGKSAHHIAPVVAMRLQSIGFDMMHRTAGGSAIPERMFPENRRHRAFLARVSAEIDARRISHLSGARANMGFDFSVYLPDQLLLLLDQTTMASTVEGRVPLLDTDLVTAAYNAPLGLHLAGGQTKAALKAIARRHVGRKVVDRRKQGFGGPESYWVRQNLNTVRAMIGGYRTLGPLAGIDLSTYLETPSDQLDDRCARDMFRVYAFLSWYAGSANPALSAPSSAGQTDVEQPSQGVSTSQQAAQR